MNDIVIIGSGGFAKEVAFLIEEINKRNPTWNILGYIDNESNSNNGKYSIYKDDNWLMNLDREIHVALGIGNPSLLKNLFEKFSKNGNIKFPNLIHPSVIGDWDRIKMGAGNIFCALNVLTTDINIGNCNIFNLNCTIGHDVFVGNFNILNPSANISGGVKIEDKILIGTGSQVLQDLSVCSNTLIGAGALLTKNTTIAGSYIGVPARILEKK